MTLALALTFAALVLLTTLALLWSGWPGWLKGVLVASVAVLYFWGDAVVHDLAGWPTADPLPERFVLLAAVIDEPASSAQGLCMCGSTRLKTESQPSGHGPTPCPMPRMFMPSWRRR